MDESTGPRHDEEADGTDGPATVTAAPGWYPVAADGGLRYWNGQSWQELAPPAPAQASYGEKYKRRYWPVLLVIACLNTVFGLGWIVLGPQVDLGIPTAGTWAYGIGVALALFLTAAFWTLLAAAFGGEPTDPEAARKPRARRAKTWVPLALVAVAVTSTLQLKPTDVDAVTITSPADGCRKFLDTIEIAGKNDASNSGIVPYLKALRKAGMTTDTALADDLAASIASPTDANLQAASESILTRCIENDWLTSEEVQAWAARLQSYATD